jgi:hypothetical protein
MVIFLLLVYGAFVGLILASFLLLAGWFAWTPLPLIFRIPIALLLVVPFGLLTAGLFGHSQSLPAVAGVLWLCLFSVFIADRTLSFAGCLGGLLVWCVLPLLGFLIFIPTWRGDLDPSWYGFLVVIMFSLALLCLPLRMCGYRLERLASEADDLRMRLISEKSVDEWIVTLMQSNQLEWAYADVVRLVRQTGTPDESAKLVAKAVCRSLGKPAPRLTPMPIDGGLASIIQWATTGPRREQYSMMQLMLWVTSTAILFSVLARTGISNGAGEWLLLCVPAIIATGLSITMLGCGWLLGRPSVHRILWISGSCVLMGMASLWMQRILATPQFTFIAPACSIGTFVWLSIWMAHLRREGFRLICV